MKKIILFVIGVLLILPTMVFAGDGIEEPKPFMATVSNENGAIIYKEVEHDVNGYSEYEYVPTENKVEYGKKVKVLYEREKGYLYVDGYEKLLSADDLTPVEEVYVPKASTLDKEQKSFVIKDTTIYNGPTRSFTKADITIPAGTEITYQSFLAPEYNFVYVKYNGVSGFISEEENGLIISESTEDEYFLVNPFDANLLDPITLQTIKVIPASTIYKNYYETNDYYYFDYEGTKGLVEFDKFELSDSKPFAVTVNKTINVYKDGSKENCNVSSKVLGTLKEGASFYSKVSYDGTIFYDNGIVQGWLIECGDTENYDYDFEYNPEGGGVADPKIEDFSKIETVEPVVEENTKTESTALYIFAAVIICLVIFVLVMTVVKKEDKVK